MTRNPLLGVMGDAGAASPRRRILLVQGDPSEAALARERLEQGDPASFEVQHVADLEGALALLSGLSVDVILLDLGLPEGGGIEALRALGSVVTDAPIVVTAETIDEHARLRALAEGAEDVLDREEWNSPFLSRSVHWVIERRRSRELHRRLERLLDTLPDAILVINHRGVVRYVNQAALQLFGRDRQDFVGELLSLSVQDGERLDIRVPRRDGERFCEMRVVHFEWVGEPAFLGSIRDLTALKTSQREAIDKAELAARRAGLVRRLVGGITALADRLGLQEVAGAAGLVLQADAENPPSAEALAGALSPFEIAFRGYAYANQVLARQNRELGDAKASLEVANQELEAFSYSVAHDLRAPLRAITGFSEALLEDAQHLEGKAREHLGRIQGGVTRMQRLIEDLLELSRVTRAQMRRSHVDLSALARVVADRLLQARPEQAGEVTVEEGLVAEADPGLLEIALENLIGNALKFSSGVEKPRVEIGRREGLGDTVFFVRDNGVGFDPALAEGLFRPFRRLHENEMFEGTGVGLSSVKRIIQRHGGRVWGTGAVGKGATFFFTLGG